MNTFQVIRSFIVEHFLFGDGGTLAADTPLFEQSILDSMAFVEVVSFIQSTFGIQIEDHELIPENFATLQKTTEFVDAKLARQKTNSSPARS